MLMQEGNQAAEHTLSGRSADFLAAGKGYAEQRKGTGPVVFGTKFAPEKPGKMGGVALWTRSCHSVSHGSSSPQDTP